MAVYKSVSNCVTDSVDNIHGNKCMNGDTSVLKPTMNKGCNECGGDVRPTYLYSDVWSGERFSWDTCSTAPFVTTLPSPTPAATTTPSPSPEGGCKTTILSSGVRCNVATVREKCQCPAADADNTFSTYENIGDCVKAAMSGRIGGTCANNRKMIKDFKNICTDCGGKYAKRSCMQRV